MQIIFEGPDCCGKTEIAKELTRFLLEDLDSKADLPFPQYFKNGIEFDAFGGKQDYFRKAIVHEQSFITQFLQQTKYEAVFDRCYPSEYVYPRIFGRETIPSEEFWYIDEAWAFLGTIIILPYRERYGDCNWDKDEYTEIIDNIGKIHNLYIDFAERTSCHTIRLQVDSEDLDDQINRIVAGIQCIMKSPDNTVHKMIMAEKR